MSQNQYTAGLLGKVKKLKVEISRMNDTLRKRDMEIKFLRSENQKFAFMCKLLENQKCCYPIVDRAQA